MDDHSRDSHDPTGDETEPHVPPPHRPGAAHQDATGPLDMDEILADEPQRLPSRPVSGPPAPGDGVPPPPAGAGGYSPPADPDATLIDGSGPWSAGGSPDSDGTAGSVGAGASAGSDATVGAAGAADPDATAASAGAADPAVTVVAGPDAAGPGDPDATVVAGPHAAGPGDPGATTVAGLDAVPSDSEAVVVADADATVVAGADADTRTVDPDATQIVPADPDATRYVPPLPKRELDETVVAPADDQWRAQAHAPVRPRPPDEPTGEYRPVDSGRNWLLPVLLGLAGVVFIIGIAYALLVATRDSGSPAPSPTPTPTPPAASTPPPSTAPPSTSPSPSASAPSQGPTGQVQLPDLTGSTLSEAESTLRALGLPFTEVAEVDDSHAPNTVTKMSPAPGLVDSTTSVTLTYAVPSASPSAPEPSASPS